MKERGNINQVVNIARSESRLVEGLVIKVWPQTRTAQVRLDGSNQYVNVNLGAIDPSLISPSDSRILLYNSGGRLYPVSAMPGPYAPSSVGVTLGDRWGSTELTIYNSATYNPYDYGPTYDVAAINSVGNVRYCGDLMPVRGNEIYTGYVFVPLTTPLTNTAFDGDSFSDVSTNTKIENSSWSTAIPGNAKALAISAQCRDSGSAGTSGLYFALYSASNGTVSSLATKPGNGANDEVGFNSGVVPCVNGDVWYRVNASGSSTMDLWLYCWGYWI